jgi:hypothetical protein
MKERPEAYFKFKIRIKFINLPVITYLSFEKSRRELIREMIAAFVRSVLI